MSKDELFRKAIGDSLCMADIDAYCNAMEVLRQPVFNELALEIAKCFCSNLLVFETADGAINLVWSLMISDALEQGDGFSFAEPAFAIYEAFDAGEHSRIEGQDPVAMCTIPLLKEILQHA